MSLIQTAIVVFSLAGCAGESSYKVLSFFFDGVPNPHETKTEAGQKTDVSSSTVTATVHGPYAAKLCNACHDRSTNALLAPIQELCYKCHVFKTNRKYIHGPLASGGCIVCHDPHSSGHKYLLVSESATFCLFCHNRQDIAKNKAHQDMDIQCTTCHEAHMSDKKYLLK